ncbi:MAG: AraC family transcriptional regulator [Hydrogenophaga sp.]|nr:AraC family transcriptional regulator [Hydrogenophaga sp.]
MSTLVRAASLTNYVAVARQCGLDPWRLLREAGLPVSATEDPDLRIAVESVRHLLEHSAALSGVEAFALLMAEGRRVSNLGVLGMLMREEPTVRHALLSIMAYGRTHNEALFQRIEESQGIAVVHADLLLNSPGVAHQAIELVVAVAIKTVRFFVGADWHPRRICFMHGAPIDVSVHRRVLGQTPEFGSDFNGFVCTSTDLDTPIASADPVVASYIRQQVQSRQQATLTVADEVRQIVLVLLPRGRNTVDQVARLMGITRRTLHRHLAAEGQVFNELVLSVRRELVSRYLQQPSRSLGEMAQLLGFADLSSFSRWHRQQFGATASQRGGPR